jgi:hypothetical protein
MNYKYHIRRVDWNDKQERDQWFNEALIKGLQNDYIVTEIINDEEEYLLYLGDDFFDSNRKFITERNSRILNWIKEECPELLI